MGPMRHVTFAVTMAPHLAGEKRLLPEEIATKLEKEGKLLANDPWPPSAHPAPSEPVRQEKPQAVKPERAILRPGRPAAGHDRRQAR